MWSSFTTPTLSIYKSSLESTITIGPQLKSMFFFTYTIIMQLHCVCLRYYMIMCTRANIFLKKRTLYRSFLDLFNLYAPLLNLVIYLFSYIRATSIELVLSQYLFSFVCIVCIKHIIAFLFHEKICI